MSTDSEMQAAPVWVEQQQDEICTLGAKWSKSDGKKWWNVEQRHQFCLQNILTEVQRMHISKEMWMPNNLREEIWVQNLPEKKKPFNFSRLAGLATFGEPTHHFQEVVASAVNSTFFSSLFWVGQRPLNKRCRDGSPFLKEPNKLISWGSNGSKHRTQKVAPRPPAMDSDFTGMSIMPGVSTIWRP